MTKKVLEDVNMAEGFRSSYLASVAGILEAADMWNGKPSMLAGLTGLAFHFIVHKKTCPSSVTIYDWQQEHLTMLDRLGIHSEVFQISYQPGLHTFEPLQAQAISRIKASIDRGVGVVVWSPSPLLEFGIITGYDDKDQVFFIQDCTCQEPDPLLYDNLGKSDVSILFYQIFYDKIPVPIEKTIQQSLEFGVEQWEKEFHINPHYASGKKGYTHLIDALKQGYDKFGLAYIFFSYSRSKEHLYHYLDTISQNNDFQDLKEAATLYQQVADKFKEMKEILPFQGAETELDTSNVERLVNLVKEAYLLENQAMEIIKKHLL